MGYYRVTGGGTIGGEYTVRGSKNAVLPLLAASVLSGDEVVLENVPHITDVFVSLEILEELGCKTKLEGRTLTIDSRNIEKTEISEEMVGKMRLPYCIWGHCWDERKKPLWDIPADVLSDGVPLTCICVPLKKWVYEFERKMRFSIVRHLCFWGITFIWNIPA